MTNFEKREAAIAELQLDPRRSNREIARKLAFSDGLVRDVREELEQQGKLLAGKRDFGGRRPKKMEPLPLDLDAAPNIPVTTQDGDADLWEQAVQDAVEWKPKTPESGPTPMPPPKPIEVPFPMFGGKSLVAKEVWRRFGDPAYYYEPFAGGLGVLLARPRPGKYEFVGDADGFITNFWRAAKQAPDDVAAWTDDPPNSLDLVARVRWLKERRASLLANLETNPEFFDAKLAGWWVWCRCSTINLNNKIALRLGPGNGIHRERQRNNLYGYIWALAERLDKVTILHGDWSKLARCAQHNANGRAKSAIFLDPPYTRQTGRRGNLYGHDSFKVGQFVQRWAVAAASADLKVALCGLEGEYDMPSTWEQVEWKSSSGDGRERIWFSP